VKLSCACFYDFFSLQRGLEACGTFLVCWSERAAFLVRRGRILFLGVLKFLDAHRGGLVLSRVSEGRCSGDLFSGEHVAFERDVVTKALGCAPDASVGSL
jgi:hypothetical protein